MPQTITPELLKTMPLPDWAADASKDDYGKLLIIAGSARLPGAAILAARAALRVGCGTVRVAAPKGVASYIGVVVPELMVLPMPETEDGTMARSALELLERQYKPCDAAVIGPGLDNHDEVNELIQQIVPKIPLPAVIDAQALTTLAAPSLDTPVDYGTNQAARIFTPHPGEMSTLIGREVDEIETDRENTALEFARTRNATLVLKGRETLIAAPDGGLYRNTAGTRGMGTAGSGDVLAGVIGGLLAQGIEATTAAVWGVHLHALAGEAAAQDKGDDGMMASDFLELLPYVLRELRSETSG
ncbi:MAG: NAD(P)H-hydrate dehydratase [Abitibacteriaceae bacterium]|nr:NAD(P)H-hydrate dehydratase [Abditibacteriaceae bacterium]MBV9868388.1 NAD(P)H-hydrate dehydratase [Abditibacteriaceae bacterium]